jgi:6-pyruvoyltetrahydropterin/6-carboxytetrahydropterin synthase
MEKLNCKNRKVSVSRKAHFNAAHRLYNPGWDDDKNKAIFGLCNNPHFHGHNYELIVTITGIINEDTGMVMDIKTLADIIDDKVCVRYDHKNLNIECPEFSINIPTAENIALMIWNILRAEIDLSFALKVRLYETPRNFVEIE